RSRLAGLFGRALLALDARGLALQLAEVVQAGAADVTLGHDLDLLDARRVQREDALDADAVRDLADRERGARAAAVLADDDALEHLDALLVAFLDQRVNANAVARAKVRDVLAPVGALDLTQKRGSAHGNLERVAMNSRRAARSQVPSGSSVSSRRRS